MDDANTQGETIPLGQGKKGINMDDWDSLIEATIDAIRVDSIGNEVRIDVTCAWEGTDRKQIIATGVADFVANEMRLSNIIDRVHRLEASAVRDERAVVGRRLFFLMRGIEPNSLDLEWPVLQETLARIEEGVLSLLEIKPVYGATILVLARDFKLLVSRSSL